MHIKTSIIPQKQTFVKVKNSNELDLEAICVFVAIGFFLDDDTYWKNKKILTPGSNNFIDENGFLINRMHKILRGEDIVSMNLPRDKAI